MSQNINTTAHEILNSDQALIPEQYKKTLQSKALMGYYQDSLTRRQYDQRDKIDQRMREMQHSLQQNERHLYELELKKQHKQNTKKEYSKVYDQMIVQRKQRQQQQRERQMWLQNKLLRQGSWLKDQAQQKQIQKQKKVEYAKELEKLMKKEEETRTQQALKFKEHVEQSKKQSQERMKLSTINTERSKNNASTAHRPHLGVKETMVWSHHSNSQSYNRRQDRPLTPRMQRMLKVQQQRYYDKGKQIQYKSEAEKHYYESLNPKRSYSSTDSKPEGYNPITNPIPYQYRNPNILKFISQHV